MKKELLKKYINNSCTPEEFEEFSNWIENKSNTKESKNLIFEDWRSFKIENPDKDEIDRYSSLLDKIHHQINLKTERKDTHTIGKATKWLSRIAAVLFVPVFGVLLYILSVNHFQIKNYTNLLTVDSIEIIAPIGSRTVVQLSDGSEVNLNYGSKLKYPLNFTGETREITLTGEAYFKVAHNPDKPFIVKAGRLCVTALGTKFNVQAYPDENTISTTLVEGKVLIERTVSGRQNHQIKTLTPGMHAVYNIKSNKVKTTKGNTYKYIAWAQGKIVFDNEPLANVVNVLSRMFNVDIEVADNVKNYTYTVTFINEPLFLILDLMTKTTPIKYKILPRRIQKDHTFSKQKIIITKR